MRLCDYECADKYIKMCQQEFGELRRLAGTVKRYEDMVTNISSVLRLDKIQSNHNKQFEDFMARKIDAQKELDEQQSRCIAMCAFLKLIDDSEGASVIYYYYINKMKMPDISTEVGISLRSCWRHHNTALKQLEGVLRHKEEPWT